MRMWWALPRAMCICALLASHAGAATITVRAGENLQAAIDSAQPGDTILLDAGATYSGNFRLRNKGSSTAVITIRTNITDSQAVAAGVRITPATAGLLAKIQSSNTMSALTTDPGAHHWNFTLVEFPATQRGFGEIIALGSGGSDQTALSQVPSWLTFDRVYIHGHPVTGQKRGIALNSASTTIVNSYISDIKAAGVETQAICGWNGPGPYTIVNNYIEAAGVNVLIGGASPKIPGMVQADIEFRRNHVSKPPAWRYGLVGTPGNVASSAAAGGALPAGGYTYRVVAVLKTAMDAWTWSERSAPVSATSAGNSKITVSWSPVANADLYRVYRGPAGGLSDRYFETTGSSFVDTGSVTPAAFDNGEWITASVWTVKNLFELKMGERVRVDANVFEFTWPQAQTGFAILFTPRNQDNTSPWIYVRDVNFTNNLVRHAASGLQITGYDNNSPSQQTQRITIRNNLFDDISAANWGGSGRFLQIGDEARDVVIDHNTVIHDGTVVHAYGGSLGAERTMPGFVLTNNLFQHNDYGILGDSHGIGLDTINTYFPGAVVTRNTLAGGSASRYPAGNEFPDVATWRAQFMNFGTADYRLKSSSPYVSSGTDGASLGANVETVQMLANIARSGQDSGGSCTVRLGQSGVQTVSSAAGTRTLTVTTTNGMCEWTAVSTESWLRIVSVPYGYGPGTIDVAFDANPSPNKAREATVKVGSRKVTIRQLPASMSSTSPPLGVWDAPADGSVVLNGSVGFGGWALDDIQVQRIRIVRDPVPGEPAAYMYIGDAVQIEGARPDAAAYGTANGYPSAERAGWGYLLLSNMLPNGGNGTFTLRVFADDVEGQTTLLGVRTLTFNNAGSASPFGAIDTPAQGGIASGTAYVNFGWALSPQPKTIAGDGSTLQVFIDGVYVGHPVYGNFRADIADLFPGYVNSTGPVGYFLFDTTAYADGVHTIAWVVTDSSGSSSGIGSRYFTVNNSSGLAPASVKPGAAKRAAAAFESMDAVAAQRALDQPFEWVWPDRQGVRTVHVAPLSRLELQLDPSSDMRELCSRYATDRLPVGSALDGRTGVFTWQPGPGFAGAHDLTFVRTSCDGSDARVRVRVIFDR